jgi:serine/threonine protein phosphatase PrpC
VPAHLGLDRDEAACAVCGGPGNQPGHGEQEKPMNLRFAGATGSATERSRPEDRYLLDADLQLFLVCDGMGGHAAGEMAAGLAARAVRHHLATNRHAIDEFDESPRARAELLRLLDDAVQYACREVYRAATSRSECAGMGTAMPVLVVAGCFGAMAHGGATRLYLRRGGDLHQLSEDHTYAGEMARLGMATAEDADAGPFARMTTRAVGLQSGVRADTLLFDILPGDCLILCTGGVHGYRIGAAEFGDALDEEDIQAVAQRLVSADRGAGSDSAAIALRVESTPLDGNGDDDLERASDVAMRIATLRRIVLFRNLDMREVCKVLNIVQPMRLAAGEAVVRVGEPSDAVYGILSGTLRVERGGQAIRRMTAGDHFGEMALLNDRPRSATVVAQTPCEILSIPIPQFHELLRTEPELSVKLLWSLAQVLSLRLDDVTSSRFDDAEGEAPAPAAAAWEPFSRSDERSS